MADHSGVERVNYQHLGVFCFGMILFKSRKAQNNVDFIHLPAALAFTQLSLFPMIFTYLMFYEKNHHMISTCNVTTAAVSLTETF